MMPSVGGKAPDFTTKDQDGREVKLSDFKGKKLVLYFYPKDMTPGCTAEACNLRDNYRSLQKQGYEVLGISTDDEKRHRKFIEREKLPFRLLADTDKSVHEKYDTWIEKSMYGRKYMGTARVTFLIDEKGKVSDIIGKVDTKDHANQILKNLDIHQNEISKSSLPVKKKSAKKLIRATSKKVQKRKQ